MSLTSKFKFKLVKPTVFIFCIFLSSLVTAQAPGYIGKRWALGYGFYFAPAINPTPTDLPFNALHEGFIEFTTSKNFALGLSARYFNTVYDNSRRVDINQGYYSNTYGQIDEHPTGSYEIRAINYSLYGKAFRHGYLSPWGKYFTFGISMCAFEASYNPSTMKVRIQEGNSYNYVMTEYSNFGPREQSYKRFDLMIGNGRSRIVKNCIVIDYGYNVNLMATILTLFDAPDDNILDDVLYPSSYIEKTSAARTRGVNRINLFLKIGYLF